MAYQFNTQQHVRIWFSGNPDVFLNEENQLRMVQFRSLNPKAKMTFLYSSKMLTPTSLKKLQSFCEKHKFEPLDFDTELLSACKTPIDKRMHQIAQIELDAHMKKQGGNLAAASDITRLIIPVLEKGTYSDFDTEIYTDKLPEFIPIKGPIIMNIGILEDYLACSNDILGISVDHNNTASPDVEQMLMPIKNHINYVYSEKIFRTLVDFPIPSSHPIVNFYYSNKPLMKTLKASNPYMTITDFRAYITNLDSYSEEEKSLLIRDSVMLFSGAINKIVENFYGDGLNNSVEDCSFKNNSLDLNFKSPMAVASYTTIEKYQALSVGKSKKNDLSWLKTGQEAIRNREDQMHSSAKVIQEKWKKHLKHDSLEDNAPDVPTPKNK